MTNRFYSWTQVEHGCEHIIQQLHNSKWLPDYIVGISRGGTIPATMLSHYLSVPMKPLMVNLRDHQECVSDTGMAEDAFGYQSSLLETSHPQDQLTLQQKKILIVDDINDTGATIEWIKRDWPANCYPHSFIWNSVWHNNVRFATLVNNVASKERVDYSVWVINKSIDHDWFVFPWENWWEN